MVAYTKSGVRAAGFRSGEWGRCCDEGESCGSVDRVCSARNDGRVRLCGIFLHLLNTCTEWAPEQRVQGWGRCWGSRSLSRGGVSPQGQAGRAAWGSDCWPKAFIRARPWGQQGCHRCTGMKCSCHTWERHSSLRFQNDKMTWRWISWQRAAALEPMPVSAGKGAVLELRASSSYGWGWWVTASTGLTMASQKFQIN